MSYWYRGHRKNPVLTDFSLEISAGEFIVLKGRNGSGKSTLARMMSGITKPKRGAIEIEGVGNFLDLRKKISIIFQNPENNLLFDKVYDDVAFGLENLKIPKSEHAIRVATALGQVGLAGFEGRSTYELSGGQKQRVAIAGVLAMNCDVIVADEPTAMLDTSGKQDIYELLLELNRAGKTIILATNIEEEARFGRIINL
ncbi:MAG: ATP-binding cassette domain-containing protein [Firmicutes bacterium]|nr:ATP-binding cassette domain-containing protein [Bacillota bacterium]